MNLFRTSLIGTAVFGVLMIVFNMESNDRIMATQLYCQEVEAWFMNSGLPPEQRPGHPDFDDRYARDCQ